MLCEASFPNFKEWQQHVRAVHGGDARYREAWCCLESLQPHTVTRQEGRAVVVNCSRSYESATMKPENEAYKAPLDLEVQRRLLWEKLFRALSEGLQAADSCFGEVQLPPLTLQHGEPIECASPEDQGPRDHVVERTPIEPRCFAACVFCAMLHWSETLRRVFVAGPESFMQSPHKVAALLAADWYHEQWPRIPQDELYASAVDLPHKTADGSETTTKVLMHKRRVTRAALRGEDRVYVCETCYDAFRPKTPTLSKFSLANFMWLGRHVPLLRNARLGHQLLLALGRVVSTKVYLSSKGVDEAARQNATSWRQKFLQSGMQGTAIVFDNGNIDAAMSSFPPSLEVLQDTFVAVFTGPESPTDAEAECMQGVSDEARRRRDEMARKALRKEVELEVEKAEFDRQARWLIDTNYVYHAETTTYRTDLVEALPEERAIPSVFEACARFVTVDPTAEDTKQAEGPATATTTAQEELRAGDAEELVKWISVMDENMDETTELTSLPALQGLLERMESQAGRVVANELMAVVEEGGYGAEDEIGRRKMLSLIHI